MMRLFSTRFLARSASRCTVIQSAVLGAALVATIGCEPGGVGDPCIPEDEYRADFGGYAKGEVNVESRSFQCETRVCLVNSFQGRVSCPYGQASYDPANPACKTPDGIDDIKVPVKPQLLERRPEDAVYCSCRCKGPDGPKTNAPFCECPDGFKCQELIGDVGLGNKQLAGSYCVRQGTEVDEQSQISPKECVASEQTCDDSEF